MCVYGKEVPVCAYGGSRDLEVVGGGVKFSGYSLHTVRCMSPSCL